MNKHSFQNKHLAMVLFFFFFNQKEPLMNINNTFVQHSGHTINSKITGMGQNSSTLNKFLYSLHNVGK